MVSLELPEVDSVKLDPDTLLTVPIEPPAAGPDRALDPWAPDPKPPAKGALPVAVELLLAAVELLPEELEEQATMPKEPPLMTIAASPAVVALPRLLENIILTPITEAVNHSYANTPWNSGGGKREGN